MAIERAGGSSDREVIKIQAIRGVREGGWLTVQSLSFQPLALPAPFFFSFPLSVAIVGERRPKRYSSAAMDRQPATERLGGSCRRIEHVVKGSKTGADGDF